jgi:hypothetical protein
MYSFSGYVNYLKGLATQFRDIGHTPENPRFSRMNINDIYSDIKTNLDTTHAVMIVEMPEGALTFTNDALMDQSFGAFLIVRNVNRKEPEQLEATYDELKILAMEVVMKIHYEKHRRLKGDKSYDFHTQFFELSKVKYQPVGPVINSCYGWRVEVDLTDTVPLSIDPSKWSDLTP